LGVAFSYGLLYLLVEGLDEAATVELDEGGDYFVELDHVEFFVD